MSIETTWDGDVITTHDPVQLTLSACPDGKHVIVKVNAPLFNDPQPPNAVPAGKPCPRLWDYEGILSDLKSDHCYSIKRFHVTLKQPCCKGKIKILYNYIKH